MSECVRSRGLRTHRTQFLQDAGALPSAGVFRNRLGKRQPTWGSPPILRGPVGASPLPANSPVNLSGLSPWALHPASRKFQKPSSPTDGPSWGLPVEPRPRCRAKGEGTLPAHRQPSPLPPARAAPAHPAGLAPISCPPEALPDHPSCPRHQPLLHHRSSGSQFPSLPRTRSQEGNPSSSP